MTGDARRRTATVLVASTRAAAGVYEDKGGPLIAAWLVERGFAVTGPVVRADGDAFAAALRSVLGADLAAQAGGADTAALADGADTAAVVDGADTAVKAGGAVAATGAGGVFAATEAGDRGAHRNPDLVITTGGTGISPTDVTPQVTLALLDYEIPGLAEALRRHGADKGVPSAVLSRGIVGVAGRTLIVNLPGSTGGVRDGLAVLGGVLDHALDQLAGADHARAGSSTASADSHGAHHHAVAEYSPGGTP